jgi:rRNA maturation protein Rpf1
VIGLTTGREANQRLNSLLKELEHAVPSAKIVRRGKSSRQELANRLRQERFSHAVAIYRWQGGPGRLDFFTVKCDGISMLRPSALLKAVRLGREYPNRAHSTAAAITHDENMAEETRRFCHTLSDALELPEVDTPELSRIKASFHVSELPDLTTQLALTSPAREHEVGPKMLISRLLWDQDDEAS